MRSKNVILDTNLWISFLISKKFNSIDSLIEKILDYFDLYGMMINVRSNVEICRPPKDNFLLNLSIDSKADYLTT